MSSRTYIGTKAYALKGSMIDSQAILKLAESASLDELVNRLRGTAYADYLTALSPPFRARKLELALRERLAALHYSVIQGSGKYALIQLYYSKNIAWDLKLALKAKALGRSYEETVEYLDMKAEELVGRRDLIIKVLSARDINEAVSMLSGTEFFADVEKAAARYNTKGEIRFFDVYIDHAILAAIAKEYSVNSKVYSARPPNVNGVDEMVAVDIDAYNVSATLRSKLWGLSEQETLELLVSPTGRLPTSTLSSMARAESTAEAVKLLEPTYRFNLQGVQKDEELIDAVEDGFSKLSKDTAGLAFVWQGLGPGAMLALIKLMEFEVGNLAAIAIGIEAGIEPKKIMSKLKM